ncbi:MAG: DUF1667 domain-containing protein [Tepidanaerobacteraceae bacterium]|jgi:CxxC motif-containing protein
MNIDKRKVICLQCPLACCIVVSIYGDEIMDIENYKCKRGIDFAKEEITNPTRILTTTVRIDSEDKDHPLLPVKTDKPIRKELLFKCMEYLAKVKIRPPVKFGEVIVKDILGTQVNIVSTTEVLR